MLPGTMDLASERSYPTSVANSTLLPMLLLSLMQQKHSPKLSGRMRDEYDYIIVGAGSAGATVAGRLSEELCVNVLLLEAGKAPPVLTEVPAFASSFWDSDVSWGYKTVPQKNTGKGLKNRQVPWPSGKALGGSSILNGMQYVRGNRKNYDDWAAQGAKGWSYEDVLPFFKKMEDNKNIKDLDSGYHGTGGPVTVERANYSPETKIPIADAVKQLGYKIVDSNGKTQTGIYDVQANTRDHQRCTSAKAYLVPAENRTNLDILTNAFVKKIVIKDGRATGVIFEYENATHMVKVKSDIIMSAGAVNTAQLLMLSGIGPRDHLQEFNIPVVADLPVGKNMQDHAAAFTAFYLNPNITAIVQKLTDPENINKYIDLRSGPLSSAGLNAFIAFLNGDSIQPSIDFPNYELYFIEGATGIFKSTYGLTSEVYKQIFEPYENKPLFFCFAQQLQPKSRGTVRLNSSDPMDPPLIDPNYFDDPEDFEDIIQGLKTCNKIGKSEAFLKIGSKPFETLFPGCEDYEKDEDKYLKCSIESVVVTTNHQVGTATMGDKNDPTTVVDPELRVKNIKGLRVVDASVMPIVPSGNTNIPTIMVAEKASEIIKKEIKC